MGNRSAGWYIFVLLFTLIAVAYWQGMKTNIQTFGSASVQFLYAVTGRRPTGIFANYPRV